jgi:hypothetical protein
MKLKHHQLLAAAKDAMKFHGIGRAVVALFVLLPFCGQAQWRTQTIQLQPGWNAVHLEVQPEPRACSSVFANLPVESVWLWTRKFSTIQFTLDPKNLLPEDPDWLVWLPPSNPRAFLSRLIEVEGNSSYLIKVASNAAPFTWQLKGQVILPHLNWYPHSLNLVGFPINSQNPPTFSDFFQFTPEVITSLGRGNQLFKIDTSGNGNRVVLPERETIQPGVAYWVACARTPKYMSAIHVTPQGAAVDFGSALIQRSLSLQNTHPSETLTLTIRLRPSESPPPNAGVPELAGPVPLSYLALNASNLWVWTDFPADGLSHTFLPGEQWTLSLGLQRGNLNGYQPQGTNGATYQGYLEVTDSASSLRIPVPVTANPSEVSTSGLGAQLPAQDANQGLWVGGVALNQVNAPAYTGTNLLSTPSPLSFRLIVHVDGTGQARLLEQVLLAWDNTLTNSVNTNGAYALYANEQSVPSTATDVKRISSAAFPYMAPVLMTGSFSNSLTSTLTVNFDDPTNPFLHRYHPLHDNKDANFQPYTNAVEVPIISRALTLTFGSLTNAAANPFLSDNQVGTYQETLSGLRAQPVLVQGGFYLKRISQINQLQGITQ